MCALRRVLLIFTVSCVTYLRADEICCCPDLSVHLDCTDSDSTKLETNGYRCVAETGATVTLQCNVADVSHDAIQSVQYLYYKTYELGSKPIPYDTVYELLDCATDSATCELTAVKWAEWSSSSVDQTALGESDNFLYICMVEFTLIDETKFNITSNTMWLDVFYNIDVPTTDNVTQKDKIDINTNDPYEMLLCELPSTNPSSKATWFYKATESDDWAAIDIPNHSRMALVDNDIADESSATFDVGTLVIMIFDPDSDEGLYRCNVTYNNTLGTSTEYKVSQFSLSGNRQDYSGTPEVKMISAIYSDEYTTLNDTVDFTCYARDTNATDEGLYQWVFENDDMNTESLDVTTGRFASLQLLNHDRTLRLPSYYEFYDIVFKCNVTRDSLTKVSAFEQPVIVPETVTIPEEYYTRTCVNTSEKINLFSNQQYMMGDDVEVEDYEQKLPGATFKWYLNNQPISGFDADLAKATELDMKSSKFDSKYAVDYPDKKCVYFSYLRSYTNKYQMLEVLKLIRDDDCADLEDTFCTDTASLELTCETQTLTVEIKSGKAQCLSVELSKDGSSLATHQFDKTSTTTCQGRALTKVFTAEDTNEEASGLQGTYTVAITPEGKRGCTTSVVCRADASTCDKPTIDQGTVTPASATVNLGDSYTVICNEGYDITGSQTMTCVADGVFDQTPTCEAQDASTCDKPTIDQGIVTPASATVNLGDSYTVICNEQYDITGSPTMTCVADGVFDQTPTCEPQETQNCWTESENTKLIGTTKVAILYDLDDAKAVCEFLTGCSAISCNKITAKNGIFSCTLYSGTISSITNRRKHTSYKFGPCEGL